MNDQNKYGLIVSLEYSMVVYRGESDGIIGDYIMGVNSMMDNNGLIILLNRDKYGIVGLLLI